MSVTTMQFVVPTQHASAKVNYNFTKKLSVQSCSKLTAALYQPATLKRPTPRNSTQVPNNDAHSAARRLGKVRKSSDEDDVTDGAFELDLDLYAEEEEEPVATLDPPSQPKESSLLPTYSFYSVNKYDKNVAKVIKQWDGQMDDTDPVQFLQKLLLSRGYENQYIETSTSKIIIHPSSIDLKQLQDYDLELVNAVKDNNLTKLQEFHSHGRCMNACNKFGESLIHLACRRSSLEIVHFLMDNISDGFVADDYGRTPLHDACWSPEPRFDVVALILDRYLDLLRHQDKRGNTPLHYVRREHWSKWCAFLHSQREIYWAPIAK